MRTIVALVLLTLSSLPGGTGELVDASIVSTHQRCVFGAFTEGVKRAEEFDPGLLGQAVRECEGLLKPVRQKIIAATGDTIFAEKVLGKIREASKRGVATAVLATFGTKKL